MGSVRRTACPGALVGMLQAHRSIDVVAASTLLRFYASTVVLQVIETSKAISTMAAALFAVASSTAMILSVRRLAVGTSPCRRLIGVSRTALPSRECVGSDVEGSR